ncbi:uncharacterized protein [Macrobrachium rosenbergii]|uniref:uncharacterized protein n=1 Tax=Macrobrachium rosenbergii TaxID=79674 RepID=UPI0034D402CA
MQSDSRPVRMEFSPLGLWQGAVFMVLWIAYGSTYLLRKPLGVIKDDLEIGLNVSPTSLGWVDTALLLPYAVISLVLGSLGDLFGPRVTLAGGLILSAAATVPMTVCHSLVPLLVLLVFSGAGQSLCWPAACSLLSKWFPDDARNSVFGMFGTCCFVGGLAGTGLAVYLQVQYGWRGVFLPPAAIVAIMGILVLFVGFDPADRGLVVPGRAASQQETLNKKSSSKSSFTTVWRIPLVPEISIAMFCVKAVRFALMFWLPLYFLRHLGYSKINAGLASTAFEVGGVVGSAMVGVVVDRWMGGKAILASAIGIGGSALMLVVFMVTASWGPIFHALFLAIAGAFNCGPDVLLAGSVASDIGEREGGASSAVTGVVNGMGSMGTVVEGPLVAAAAAWFGWSSLVPLMIILSSVGAASALRANVKHIKLHGRVKVPAGIETA